MVGCLRTRRSATSSRDGMMGDDIPTPGRYWHDNYRLTLPQHVLQQQTCHPRSRRLITTLSPRMKPAMNLPVATIAL